MNFRSTTASFTVSAEPGALLSCANLPADSALYDVSVRRLTALLRASFPRCLAAPQLLFASNCCTLKKKYRGSLTEDLHLISSCPCRAYTTTGADKGRRPFWPVLCPSKVLLFQQVRCLVLLCGSATRYTLCSVDQRNKLG